MKIEYDPTKNQTNIAKHGISFDIAVNFEFETSITWVDDRFDYGEVRYCELGYIGFSLYVLVYTLRGNTIRIISLRPATRKEVTTYANT